MKKNNYKIMGATLALAAALTACSNNDFESAPAINGNGMITVFAPQGSNISTRTAYNQEGSDLKVTWNASGEDMYTINATADGWTAGQLKQVNGTSGSTSANFYAYDATASKRVSLNAGTLFAFYPQNSNIADKFTSLSSDGTSVSVPLTLDGQSGKLEDLQKYDYMTATSTVSTANGETNVEALQMNHEIAVLHLGKGIEVSMASGSVTKIELSATSGLYGSGTMTISRNGSDISSSVSGTTGTITVNGNFAVEDSKLAEDIYVAVLPSSFNGLKAKFTYSNGDSYTYAYSGNTSQFAKGKMYNWTPEIAAVDKEFTIGTYKREKYHWYQINQGTYSSGIYTIDKLVLLDSTNPSKYGDFKISFIIKVNNGDIAKCTTFKLKSVKAAYAMYDTNKKFDVDRIESFNIQGWYTSSDCSGTPSQTPDATHIYGKCIVGIKQLNLDGSDFYKGIMKNCEFNVVNGYGKEATFTKDYVEEYINTTNKNASYKFQTPDGWKTLSWSAILAL